MTYTERTLLKPLIINIMIVLAVCFVVFLEHNPLALLALTLMLPLPIEGGQPRYFPMSGGMDDDEESRPIGFTADLVA